MFSLYNFYTIMLYFKKEDFYMRNVICFHGPNEDNAYLSNWFLCNFEVDNIQFT